jgi:hypothetical protein
MYMVLVIMLALASPAAAQTSSCRAGKRECSSLLLGGYHNEDRTYPRSGARYAGKG